MSADIPGTLEYEAARAGGWTQVFSLMPEDWERAKDEVIASRTRALRSTAIRALDFVEQMPQLEFLEVCNLADIGPIEKLRRLRGLNLDSWERGIFDIATLPELEWLHIGEQRGAHLKESFARGHSKLRHLYLDAQPWPDLGAFAGLTRIEELHTGGAKLTSTAGIEACAGTLKVLGLHDCPKLQSLNALPSQLPKLKGLVVGNAKAITDLSVVQGLRELRYLEVRATKMPSLEVLRGHPALEAMRLKTIPANAADLFSAIPNLRVVQGGNFYHLREDGWVKSQPSDKMWLIRETYHDAKLR